MTTTSLAPFYKGWDRYQGLLVESVGSLTDEQLALRAAPHLSPVWMLAAHIIGTRVGWFQGLLGEVSPELAAVEPWDADDAPQRSAAELVHGLELTWSMIQDCLNMWTPATLEQTITSPRGNIYSFQWVIFHVLEHDLHHGGELALTLGMHGLPTPDL
jgi:uncharacterized damage-inducible protein DinB